MSKAHGECREERLVDLMESIESGTRPRGGVRGIEHGVASVGGEHITSEGGFDFTNVKYVPRPFFEAMRRGHLKKGDVLIVKDGATTGKVALVDDDFPFNEAAANEHVFICRPRTGMSSRYLALFLRSPEGQRRVLSHFKGSAQGGINRQFAEGTLIPVVSVEEQQRVAAFLERALERLGTATTYLASASRTLQTFKRMVLASACSGSLTADWRGVHSDGSGYAALSDALEHRSGRRRGSEVVSADPDQIAAAPDGWVAASVDQIALFVTDGEHQTPSRTREGVPLLSARNVLDGRIVFDPVDYIAEDTFNALRRRLDVSAGDVLLTCSGTIGRSSVVEEGMQFALVRSVAVIRPAIGNGEFVSLMLRSPQLQRQIDAKKTETAQANIFQNKIRSLTLPFPPLEEQSEIVRRVSAMFAAADAADGEAGRAEVAVRRTAACILARGFSRGDSKGSA